MYLWPVGGSTAAVSPLAPRTQPMNHHLESVFKHFFKGSDKRYYRHARAPLPVIQPFSLTLFPDFLTAGHHCGSGLIAEAVALVCEAPPWWLQTSDEAWGRIPRAVGRGCRRDSTPLPPPLGLFRTCVCYNHLTSILSSLHFLMYLSFKGRTNGKTFISGHKSGGH